MFKYEFILVLYLIIYLKANGGKLIFPPNQIIVGNTFNEQNKNIVKKKG